jgi:hypothetical protein
MRTREISVRSRTSSDHNGYSHYRAKRWRASGNYRPQAADINLPEQASEIIASASKHIDSVTH